MQNKTITGYCDPLSVGPGDSLRVMVSCEREAPYEADIVQVICGDDSAGAPGLIEEPVASAIDGSYPGRTQAVDRGSFVLVPASAALAGLESFAVDVLVYPTLVGGTERAVLAHWNPDRRCGFALMLSESGEVRLMLGNGSVTTLDSGKALPLNRWSRIVASYDGAEGAVFIEQTPLPLGPGDDAVLSGCRNFDSRPGAFQSAGEVPLTIAALSGDTSATRPATEAHFNGKIEAPHLYSAPRAHDDVRLAGWDFSVDIASNRVADTGPHGLHGTLVNLPTRAVTGHNWDGSVHAWTQAPEQYGAIHFHDDDIYDVGWAEDFRLTIPDDMPSGVYAVRIRQGEDEDRITFFVRPRRGQATAPLLFLAPTASYLAYANYRLRLVSNPIFGDGKPNGINDVYLRDHPELGSSLYDTHSDYSGVHFSSRLRPIQNLKSGGNRAWQFPADTNLLAWLRQIGQPFDVVTDEDLHAEGASLLERYRCVITGTHPEYYSTEMLDAVQGYLEDGGRLMYMGGNGFYWRIAFHPELPGVIEVRRAEDGTRAWMAQPGEYYHAFTGEYGGLWRRIGRAPNRLVGVGFAAQGFDRSGHYRRAAGANDPRAAFVFEGVPDEIIGDFGSLGGGAAGEEIDRFDLRLGSPPHALVLASSEGHSKEMLRTKEEFLSTVPWFDDPKVRADLTFFEAPNGGAVFSTGSITWGASLAHNGYDNNVARITANVLRRFLDDEPFVPPRA